MLIQLLAAIQIKPLIEHVTYLDNLTVWIADCDVAIPALQVRHDGGIMEVDELQTRHVHAAVYELSNRHLADALQ